MEIYLLVPFRPIHLKINLKFNLKNDCRPSFFFFKNVHIFYDALTYQSVPTNSNNFLQHVIHLINRDEWRRTIIIFIRTNY